MVGFPNILIFRHLRVKCTLKNNPTNTIHMEPIQRSHIPFALLKKQILPLLLIATFFSCSGSKEFTVTGKLPIDGFDGRMVYLYRMDDDLTTFSDIDSTRITGDTFHFKGTVPDSIVGYYIFIGKEGADRIRHSPLIFIPEEGNIQMHLDENYNSTLSGPGQNNRLGELLLLTEKLNVTTKMVYDSLRAAQPEATKFETPEALTILKKQLGDNAYSLLKELTGTPFFDEILVRYGYHINRMDYQELYDLASERYRNKGDADLRISRERGKSKVGKPFLELYTLDIHGNEVALSSYVGKGKTVLLVFWASSCGGCLKEIPILKEIYSKYKDAGFEIISISLDSKTRWEKELKRQNMEWLQLNSKDGDQNARYVYGARAIPHTVLVDKDGIVVAKNVRGSELNSLIEKLLE